MKAPLIRSFLAFLTFSALSLPSASAQDTTRVSVDSAGAEGNNISSGGPSLSSDGRYVAFGSHATNLVPGDTNGSGDIFVHDRQTSLTSLVSVNSVGVQGNSTCNSPSISADGRFVAFESYANNLFPGDTNGYIDIFLHDRLTSQTNLVSVTSGGVQGDNHSTIPIVSADGTIVAFRSFATNLVPGDTNNQMDIFVHNLQTGQTSRVSVDSAGVQGDNASGSYGLSVSDDGRYVTFESEASNLVPNDVQNSSDIFVHDLQTGQTSRVSVDSAGVPANYHCYSPSISADDLPPIRWTPGLCHIRSGV